MRLHGRLLLGVMFPGKPMFKLRSHYEGHNVVTLPRVVLTRAQAIAACTEARDVNKILCWIVLANGINEVVP